MGMVRTKDVFFEPSGKSVEENLEALKRILGKFDGFFKKNDVVGIKLHWGERGNESYLPPDYAALVASWLKEQGAKPFVVDTTVLYSGGRRNGVDSLQTAYEHGYTPDKLGCPVVIGDGLGGRDVFVVEVGYPNFQSVEVASIVNQADGFVVFSHFKGHMASGFGGAMKNISMGFASRAQKQRMHSDAHPQLNKEKCTQCGVCIEVCPVGAARWGEDGYPEFDLNACIGDAQCIAMCPAVALRVMWEIDKRVFQERLVETAAAVWNMIKDRSVVINALLKVTKDCDCLPGEAHVVHDDVGFVAGFDPVIVDAESVKLVGAHVFDRVHPNVPWRHQFEHAVRIGMTDVNPLKIIDG